MRKQQPPPQGKEDTVIYPAQLLRLIIWPTVLQPASGPIADPYIPPQDVVEENEKFMFALKHAPNVLYARFKQFGQVTVYHKVALLANYHIVGRPRLVFGI